MCKPCIPCYRKHGIRGRLGYTTAGNNSDTAVCGVRWRTTERKIGNTKATSTTPHHGAHRFIHASSSTPPRRGRRRRRRHTRDWQFGAPTVRRSDWPTAAVTFFGSTPHAHTHALRGRTYTRHTRKARARLQPRRKLSGFGECVFVRSSESVRALYCSTRLRTRIAAAVVNYH